MDLKIEINLVCKIELPGLANLELNGICISTIEYYRYVHKPEVKIVVFYRLDSKGKEVVVADYRHIELKDFSKLEKK